MSRQVDRLHSEVVYQGFFTLERHRLRHGLFRGGLSAEITRERLRRDRVAAVLPYDPRQDAVVLVEQFRIGALEAAGGAWLLETVAGVAESGETMETVARRESQEEADLELGPLERICDYFPSPGASSERVTLFCARVSAPAAGGYHGCADEDEDIRSHVLPADEALELIDTGVINSAMPIIALQWLALNRARLQDVWTD